MIVINEQIQCFFLTIYFHQQRLTTFMLVQHVPENMGFWLKHLHLRKAAALLNIANASAAISKETMQYPHKLIDEQISSEHSRLDKLMQSSTFK